MAIKVECGDCGKTYNVKDEMDGKKIRCKECSAVIPVRAESEDEWDDTYEDELPPPVRKSPKQKAKRRSSSDGMPSTVRISLICVGGIVAITLLTLVGYVSLLVRHPAHPPILLVVCFGVMLRLLTQVTVFVGIVNGSSSTRIPSIILAGLGVLLLGAEYMRGPQQAGQEWVVPLVVFSIFLRVGFIGCMLTPSAGDHMRQ